jgi:hypothetical protein
MAPGQDWCLQCGAGAPGSVSGGSWRPAAAIAGATLLLVLGAAGAGYAALSKKDRKAPVVTATVAQVAPVPTASVPVPATPAPLTGIAKPPTIPLKAATPSPAATTPATTPTNTTETGGQTPTTNTGGSESKPKAVLLDTNAAATYNPYGYPAEWFGDPSLAIDGDTSTGWTAQVNPATAPNLAEGVLIDLKATKKLASVKLSTTTPGMTVQVYGANGKEVPKSITDPAWATLSRSVTVHKRHARIGLRNQKKSYEFIVLWISKAPASATGTPEAPGRISVNELELFPVG